MGDDGVFVFRREPAAPMIRAKRFGFAAGPNLYSAITDHDEVQIAGRDFAERMTQMVGRAFQPIEVHIHAYQLFPAIRSLFHDRLAIDLFDVLLPVGDSSQSL